MSDRMDIQATIILDGDRVDVTRPRRGKPSVFIARCDAEERLTAWSNAGKARNYIDDRYSDDLEWERDGATWTGRDADGEPVASVRGVEIKDPAALAARWPERLPGTMYIDDAPPGDA